MQETMTVKEVADVLGVHPEAIKKHIRRFLPEIIKNGVTTHLNEQQVTLIKLHMQPTTEVVGNKTDIEKLMIIKEAEEYKKELKQPCIDFTNAKSEFDKQNMLIWLASFTDVHFQQEKWVDNVRFDLVQYDNRKVVLYELKRWDFKLDDFIEKFITKDYDLKLSEIAGKRKKHIYIVADKFEDNIFKLLKKFGYKYDISFNILKTKDMVQLLYNRMNKKSIDKAWYYEQNVKNSLPEYYKPQLQIGVK